jgi:hypothetical protein
MFPIELAICDLASHGTTVPWELQGAWMLCGLFFPFFCFCLMMGWGGWDGMLTLMFMLR